jgi:hypothetical protein
MVGEEHRVLVPDHFVSKPPPGRSSGTQNQVIHGSATRARPSSRSPRLKGKRSET